MSDPTDLAAIGSHAASGLGGGGLIAAVMAFLRSKESSALAAQLAVMEEKLDQLVTSSAKHDGLSEKFALLEQRVATIERRRR